MERIKLTPEVLQKIAPTTKLSTCQVYAPLIEAYANMPEYEVNTVPRLASFLSQILHESGSFRWLKEIWGPTPAQKRYSYPGKLATDLGNTAYGDGKKFMGRGLIQITGKANYTRISKSMFGDLRLLDHPELLEVPENAVKSAFMFWAKYKLNVFADNAKKLANLSIVSLTTKVVNGGTNGLQERIAFYEKALIELTKINTDGNV